MLKLNAGNKIVAIKRLVPVSDIGGQGGDWDLWPDSQNTFVLKHFKITEPTIFPWATVLCASQNFSDL